MENGYLNFNRYYNNTIILRRYLHLFRLGIILLIEHMREVRKTN